jgi:hypothetical protein
MKNVIRIARHQSQTVGSSATRIMSVAALGLALTGCAGWPGPYASGRHLSDNPFDDAIESTGDHAAVAKEARRRLLLRFPTGSPTGKVRRYLESIGASCTNTTTGPAVCRYSQYLIWGERGVFGVIWRERSYFDFTIRLLPGQGPIRDVTLCQALTDERERGPGLGKWQKPRESKFKPCTQTPSIKE